MGNKLGGISFSQPVSDMSIPGCYLGVSVTENILNKPQVFSFLVQIGTAAVPEDMAGVARMLQVTSSQCLVHDGTETIPGDAPQQVPIR